MPHQWQFAVLHIENTASIPFRTFLCFAIQPFNAQYICLHYLLLQTAYSRTTTLILRGWFRSNDRFRPITNWNSKYSNTASTLLVRFGFDCVESCYRSNSKIAVHVVAGLYQTPLEAAHDKLLVKLRHLDPRLCFRFHPHLLSLR